MRRDARRLVGSITLAVISLGSQASSARGQVGPRTDQKCTSSIDGHVVDQATHQPVAGATVRLDGAVVALTDAAGRFVLRRLCPGRKQIAVERIDCERVEKTVMLTTTASMELELRRGEVIAIEGEAPRAVDMQSTAVLSGEALERTRGQAFSEALADLPGVSQLRSASGVAKPIIRGHFGRRLLLLVDSIRHRAQEWGLDHAPEIDPFTAGKLTVVRGAAGVRYGSDAIGGAILVDPPELVQEPGAMAGELHLIGYSNGRGGGVAARLQGALAALPGLAWQLDGSFKRLAAPETPDYPLDNTGIEEWSAGSRLRYHSKDADYELSYRHYQARLGVCSCLRIESSEDFFAQLEQKEPLGVELYDSSFAIGRPYQAVTHELALGRLRQRLSHGTLTATYALQFDHRREFDVVRSSSFGPQFDFQLATHEANLIFEHQPIHLNDHLHLRGQLGVAGLAQIHGYGGLSLIPDHRSWGAGVFASQRLLGHDFEVAAGIRYDLLSRTASIERIDFLRLVRSGQLAAGACGAGDPDPVDCHSLFHTVSASLGALRQLSSAWSVKLDVSTAARAPNTDEQYLNGTAPTFPVLALGKPDLGVETTYSTSATTSYRGRRLTLEASAHASLITDYIYFAPAIDDNGDPIFDVLIRGTFPRFVTRPVDAVFYGADGGVAARLLPWLELGAQLSLVRAKNRTDDSFLVFVPPARVRGHATVRRRSLGGLRKLFATIETTYVARQGRFDLAADLAPPPDAYVLFGGELGAETHVGGETVKLALRGTNLLNARYRVYTSLLRYFADQPGWQVMARLSVRFASAAP